MRNTKKVISILLTLLMVVGMMSTFAFAADYTGSSSDNAKVTIDNASKGQKYALYKIFDAKTGSNGSITYTLMVGKTSAPNLKVTKNGVEVDAFVVDSTKKTITSNYDNNFGANLSDSDKAELKSYGQLISEVTANSNTVEFTGLDYGYYLVATDNGALISVNSTNKNVTIHDKNENTPTTDGDLKTIKDTSGQFVTTKAVHFGESVTYKISFKAQNYINGKLVTNYYVTDTTNPVGLLANLEITSVKVGNEDITSILKGNAEKLTYDADGKLTIPWAENGVSKYNNNSVVEIIYTGEITDKQAIAGEGSYNQASISHSNIDGETTTDIEESKVITKSYAAAIKKVNGSGESLTGVEFTLPFDVVKTADGVYRRAISTDADNVKTKIVTDNDGIIVINGLDTNSFDITETKAPDGYTLPAGDFTITPEEVSSTVTTTTFKVWKKDGKIVSKETVGATEETIGTKDIAATPLVVVNEQGNALPSTGGIGTTIFYILGAILVIGAGVVFVTRRRMHSEK